MFRVKHQNQPALKAEAALTAHVQEMFVRDRQAERASGGRKDDRSAADEYGLRMRLSRCVILVIDVFFLRVDNLLIGLWRWLWGSRKLLVMRLIKWLIWISAAYNASRRFP